MELKKNGSGKIYLSVIADGKFHQTVPEGTPGQVKREIKDKKTGHVTSIKNELLFDELSGKVTNVSFQDGDYGKQLRVEIDNKAVITLSTASNFGEDLMKKLVGMDLSVAYRFVPYAFETEDKKTRKGISVYLGKQKMENFYWNPLTKKVTNGMPEPEGDTSGYDSDDWKIHYMKVRKFLISQVEKLCITAPVDDGIEYPEEDIAPEDIPF